MYIYTWLCPCPRGQSSANNPSGEEDRGRTARAIIRVIPVSTQGAGKAKKGPTEPGRKLGID